MGIPAAIAVLGHSSCLAVRVEWMLDSLRLLTSPVFPVEPVSAFSGVRSNTKWSGALHASSSMQLKAGTPDAGACVHPKSDRDPFVSFISRDIENYIQSILLIL